jgi:hypothetical protein
MAREAWLLIVGRVFVRVCGTCPFGLQVRISVGAVCEQARGNLGIQSCSACRLRSSCIFGGRLGASLGALALKLRFAFMLLDVVGDGAGYGG